MDDDILRENLKLKSDIKLLIQIILKLDSRYMEWIEKNIGNEYLENER